MLNASYILKTYNRPECILSASCGKGRSTKVISKPKRADDKFIAALKENGAMRKSEISFAKPSKLSTDSDYPMLKNYTT